MRGVTVQMAVLIVGVVVLVTAGVAAAGTPTITPKELKAKLGDSDLIIVDVRRAGHWEASDRKIPGAGRGSTHRTRPWSCTARDPSHSRVPGWHARSSRRVFSGYSSSRAAGSDGSRKGSPPRRSNVQWLEDCTMHVGSRFTCTKRV
jgi:hypothetical protein